jgi:hypothetical protein
MKRSGFGGHPVLWKQPDEVRLERTGEPEVLLTTYLFSSQRSEGQSTH